MIPGQIVEASALQLHDVPPDLLEVMKKEEQSTLRAILNLWVQSAKDLLWEKILTGLSLRPTAC